MLAHRRSEVEPPHAKPCPPPRLRQATASDIETLIGLKQLCLNSGSNEHVVWTRAQLQNLLRAFPQGQIVVECAGQVLGSVASLIVSVEDDASRIHGIDALTINDSGAVHDPDGDTLCCVDTCVHPNSHGDRLRQMLCEGRREVCRWLNLRRILTACCTSGYASHAPSLSPEAYLTQVAQGNVEDGVLDAELREGFVVRSGADQYVTAPRGSEFVTLVEWQNPDYQPPHVRVPVRARSGVMQRPAAPPPAVR